MKVGVQLPEVEWVARWPQLRQMARTAEPFRRRTSDGRQGA